MSTRNETETVNLRKMIVHEYNMINHLEEKLKIYNKDLCEKKDLQIRVDDLQRVLEDVAWDITETNENHMKKKESIIKKLENCEVTESTLSVNNQKLRDAIDRMNGRIHDLRLCKENLISNIEKLNKCNENLENQLGTVKVRVNINYFSQGNGILCRYKYRHKMGTFNYYICIIYLYIITWIYIY